MKYKYLGDKPINFDGQFWNPGDEKPVANEKIFLKAKLFEKAVEKKPKKLGRKKKSE